MPSPIKAREAEDTASSKESRSYVDGDFRHNPSYARQAIYSPTTLAFYDLIASLARRARRSHQARSAAARVPGGPRRAQIAK